MRKRLGISLVLLSVPCLAATFMPCGPGENPAGFERFHTQGEPYSVAECAGFDAKRHFEELRMDLEMDSLESIKLGHLGKVAKAALEAGLYDEAKPMPTRHLPYPPRTGSKKIQ